jgi:hypothetical protein
MDTLEIVRWAAALLVIAASLMVAWGEPTKLVAFGFWTFTAASIIWIGAAWWEDEWALATQNVVLLAVNLWGVWRWTRRARRESGGDGVRASAPRAEGT